MAGQEDAKGQRREDLEQEKTERTERLLRD
jgi:hypothetical protein